MTLLIDNDIVRRVLKPAAVRRALESAYRDLASGEAVCRPRIDIRIPTRDPAKFYQWGTMEGGSTGGYFAIRMKSDVVYEREYEGVRTREKYCSRPGRYCGLVFLTDVETGEPLAIINDGTDTCSICVSRPTAPSGRPSWRGRIAARSGFSARGAWRAPMSKPCSR